MKLKKKTNRAKTSVRYKKSNDFADVENIENEKKEKKKKLYFDKNAHLAIVEFQKAEEREKKSEIYVEKIKPSFDKLAENLIYIHGFSRDKEHFHILKSDCVTFLYEILEKFDPARGSKAFSYFNVCAKNFLIIQNKKATKRKIRNISIDDESLSLSEKAKIEAHQVIPSQEQVMIKEEDKIVLRQMLQEIKKRISNPGEVACLDAIITLFNRIEDLDFLNKRAVFVYLRELSGLNPKQLSVAMSNVRKHYRDLKQSNSEYILFKFLEY